MSVVSEESHTSDAVCIADKFGHSEALAVRTPKCQVSHASGMECMPQMCTECGHLSFFFPENNAILKLCVCKHGHAACSDHVRIRLVCSYSRITLHPLVMICFRFHNVDTNSNSIPHIIYCFHKLTDNHLKYMPELPQSTCQSSR